MTSPAPHHDPYDDDQDECPNCGGDGYVSACFEEWACRYPDEGCDDCMRRCDWCNRKPKQTAGPDLSAILGDAIKAGKDKQ